MLYTREFLKTLLKVRSSGGNVYSRVYALERGWDCHCAEKKANLLDWINIGGVESAFQNRISLVIPGEWGKKGVEKATWLCSWQ